MLQFEIDELEAAQAFLAVGGVEDLTPLKVRWTFSAGMTEAIAQGEDSACSQFAARDFGLENFQIDSGFLWIRETAAQLGWLSDG